MIAEYLEIDHSHIKEGDSLFIRDDESHHLLNVRRVQINEKIMILNGKGIRLITTIKIIGKKEIELQVEKIEQAESRKLIDLYVGICAKEAMEEIIRMSVELGVTKVCPLISKNSQRILPNEDRIKRIVISALKQSNNPNMPVISTSIQLEKLNLETYSNVFLFSKNSSGQGKVKWSNGNTAILIGPEGGFTTDEEELMLARGNVLPVKFPSPILRSITAAPTSIGFVFSLINHFP